MPRSPITADYMRDWGRYAKSSPLYSHLVELISEDEELLGVVNRMEHEPPPNLLFAGVHYLLMKGEDPELASFYESITDRPRPPEEVDGLFKGFVMGHEDQLVELGRTRYTQTNECRRCVALLPGIWKSGVGRFHLVDIGTSAGLNLALDRYQYRWNGLSWGDGPVVLATRSRGSSPVPREVEVLSRVGLDLNPIDPSSPDDQTWLDALIWPGQEERRHRLRGALTLIAGLDIQFVAGDALETLSATVQSLPPSDPVVIMNSFTLNQFSRYGMARLERVCSDLREGRSLIRLSLELEEFGESPVLRLDDGSGWVTLGKAHHHGEWIDLH